MFKISGFNQSYHLWFKEFELAGPHPRSFTIKDDTMIVADKIGDFLQVVKINPTNGLVSAGEVIEAPHQPGFIMFYE